MRFAQAAPKAEKARRGRTRTEATPIEIRSRIALGAGFADRAREALAAKLGHVATLIERGTMRFEDVNGPKGGVDIVCRIELAVSSRPAFHVEATAETPELAFAAVLPVISRAFEKLRDKHGLGVGHQRGRRSVRGAATAPDDPGEIIGRRVGRGPAALERALERPEKRRRDSDVDTSQPGVSASDRRAGGGISARRNTLADSRRATAALEDSRTKPSRKSTRRSANRGKPSQGKERTAVARSVTPSARRAKR